jgi:hypothetical protein
MARPIKKYKKGGEVSARKKKRRARKDGTAPEKMTAKKAGPIKTKTEKAYAKMTPKMAADKYRMEETSALKSKMEKSRAKFLKDPATAGKYRKEIDAAVAQLDKDIRSGKEQDRAEKLAKRMGVKRRFPRY